MTPCIVGAGNVIKAADEILDRDGWCQGALKQEESGAVCAMGAINCALYGNAYYHADLLSDRGFYNAVDALNNAIPAEFTHNTTHNTYGNDGWWYRVALRVVTYNNTPGRTREEIREWFAKAAANAGWSCGDEKSDK